MLARVAEAAPEADRLVGSPDLYRHEHDPAGLLGEHAEVTIVGGRVVHSAGAVAEAVGAPVAEDPVAVGGGAADAHVHVH